MNIDPEYHYEAINVEAQQNNPHSLLWWMKRLIALRKQYQAFGRGTLEFLHPENRKVLAFLRQLRGRAGAGGGEPLALRPVRGAGPLAIPGHGARWSCSAEPSSPPIGDRPYLLTLGPHAFYWFALDRQRATVRVTPQSEEDAPESWSWPAVWTTCSPSRGPVLEEALPSFLQRPPVVPASKARRIRATEVVDAIPVPRATETQEPAAGRPTVVVIVHVDFTEGDPETYALPIGVAVVDGRGRRPGPAPGLPGWRGSRRMRESSSCSMR